MCSLLIFLCVYGKGRTSACIYVCVHTWRDEYGLTLLAPHLPSAWFREKTAHWMWGSPIPADLPGRKPQGPCCLYLHSTGFTGEYQCVLLFYLGSRDYSQVFMLIQEALYWLRFSPVPICFSFFSSPHLTHSYEK